MAETDANEATVSNEVVHEDIELKVVPEQASPNIHPTSEDPPKPHGGVTIQALHPPIFHKKEPSSSFYSSGRHDHYLKLSYVLTACFVCCCAVPSLPFTLPAIYFAKLARKAEVKRNMESMIRNERFALFLNIGGMMSYVVLCVAVIVVIIVMKGQDIMAYQPST